MIIDAHQHFWRYIPAEYGWIDERMSILRRDFLPNDLARETAAASIDGTIAVQARQTFEETRWLLELAHSHPLIRGVVGWVSLVSPDLEPQLERLSHNKKLRGVR